MRTQFQAKFLSYLAQAQRNRGFTLIELLVVIIIIGILSAIALPTFLNQANKARESEARQYIGFMNRSQQAYFMEKARFAPDVVSLGVGIKTDTSNYTFAIDAPAGGTSIIRNVAYPKNATQVRAYTGAVELNGIGNEAAAVSIVCQSKQPSIGDPEGVTVDAAPDRISTCATNWEPL